MEILKSEPKGIRWVELIKKVKAAFPEMQPNTIAGSLWNLDSIAPNEVYKPAKGVWRHVTFQEKILEKDITAEKVQAIQLKESSLYDPFADWLKNEASTPGKAGGIIV